VSRGLLLVPVALAVALVLATSAASRPLTNSGQAPPDATGDSGSAPDITTLAMENDNAGKLMWKIGIGNRTAWAPPDYLQIPIDADRRDSTGPDGGFEFTIEADAENGTRLFAWDGTSYFDARSKTVTSSLANGVLSISIDFRELGSEAPRFYFYSDTAPPDSDDFWDEAPAAPASYVYAVIVPVLLDKFTPPKTMRAGATASLSISVWTDDAKSPAISCKAKASGKAVKGKSSWAAVSVVSPDGPEIARKGVAGCKFAVPRSMRGKTLSATVTLTKEGVTLRQSFSKKIR
jgi:hypothetical protein